MGAAVETGGGFERKGSGVNGHFLKMKIKVKCVSPCSYVDR